MNLDIEIHAIKLPVELMQICGVSAACIYAVILNASENDVAEISRNDISRLTGLKSTAIKDALRKLEALGIVERHYNIGYATTYHVTNILPVEQPEEVPAEPTEPARQSEQQQQELQAKHYGSNCYGEYGWIALSDKEYNDLISEYGKRTVDKTISEIDTNREANKQYLPVGVRPGAYGKAYVKDWIRKDEKRKNKGKKDIIQEQEMREIEKYLDLVD